MRRRAWAAWALLAAGLGVGAMAQHLPGRQGWELLSGLLVLAAIVLGIALLPWRRWIPGLEPMPGLFARPHPNERWCAQCGHPTPAQAPCRTCGHTPASRRG